MMPYLSGAAHARLPRGASADIVVRILRTRIGLGEAPSPSAFNDGEEETLVVPRLKDECNIFRWGAATWVQSPRGLYHYERERQLYQGVDSRKIMEVVLEHPDTS